MQESQRRPFRKRALLILLVVVSTLILLLVGTFFLIAANSRAPPFPVTWKTPVAGNRIPWGTLLEGDVAYLLRAVGFSPAGGCSFRVLSLNLSNGSSLWNSGLINATGPCLDYANLFHIGPSIYFLDANSTVLYLVELDSSTGKNLSSYTELIPGKLAETDERLPYDTSLYNIW